MYAADESKDSYSSLVRRPHLSHPGCDAAVSRADTISCANSQLYALEENRICHNPPQARIFRVDERAGGQP